MQSLGWKRTAHGQEHSVDLCWAMRIVDKSMSHWSCIYKESDAESSNRETKVGFFKNKGEREDREGVQKPVMLTRFGPKKQAIMCLALGAQIVLVK
jgi:hypothetical protein